MENTKIQKIKKSAGTTAKVLKVIKTIILVGMICCIVGGVFTMLIQKDELGTFSILGRPITVHGMVDIENVNVGGFEFLKVFNIDNPFILAGLNCLVAAVICLAAYIVVNVIRNAFLEIESSDTPFTKNVMNSLLFGGNGRQALIPKHKALAVGGQEQVGDRDSLDLLFAVPDVFNRKVAGQKLRG